MQHPKSSHLRHTKKYHTGADKVVTGKKTLLFIPKEPAVKGTTHLNGPKNLPSATLKTPYLPINF